MQRTFVPDYWSCEEIEDRRDGKVQIRNELRNQQGHSRFFDKQSLQKECKRNPGKVEQDINRRAA